MFTKIHTKVKIYKKVIHEIPHWIIEKKIIDSNTNLSRDFNVIHLHTHTRLHDLDKCIGWK